MFRTIILRNRCSNFSGLQTRQRNLFVNASLYISQKWHSAGKMRLAELWMRVSVRKSASSSLEDPSHHVLYKPKNNYVISKLIYNTTTIKNNVRMQRQTMHELHFQSTKTVLVGSQPSQLVTAQQKLLHWHSNHCTSLLTNTIYCVQADQIPHTAYHTPHVNAPVAFQEQKLWTNTNYDVITN